MFNQRANEDYENFKILLRPIFLTIEQNIKSTDKIIII